MFAKLNYTQYPRAVAVFLKRILQANYLNYLRYIFVTSCLSHQVLNESHSLRRYWIIIKAKPLAGMLPPSIYTHAATSTYLLMNLLQVHATHSKNICDNKQEILKITGVNAWHFWSSDNCTPYAHFYIEFDHKYTNFG